MPARPHLAASISLCVAAACYGLGCSSEQNGIDGDLEGDEGPPAAITDLAATDSTTTSITLSWTAPTADDTHAMTSSYDLRTSEAVITDATWETALQVENEPGSAPGGWLQSMVVDGLAPGTIYYFAIKALDSDLHASGLSNVIAAKPVAEVVVVFADPTLESVVREKIGKPSGAVLRSDCLGIGDLDGSSAGIASLEGLSECRNLESLDLEDNKILDLAPLSALVKLRNLQLAENLVESLDPLSNLTLLDHLSLWSNRIQETGPMAGLLNLVSLDLRWNRIEEIGALVANQGLGAGDHIYLDGNPLSEAAIASLATLTGRGATVSWSRDEIPPAAVTDLHVTAIGGTSVTLEWGAPGDDGFLGTAHSYDLRHATELAALLEWTAATPVEGLPAPLPATVPQQMEVTGLTTGTTYYFAIKSVDEAGNGSSLSNVVSGAPFVDAVVVFADPNLEAAVREAIQKPAGEIHRSELVALTELDLAQREIVSLDGIESCLGLQVLRLHANHVSDLAPLAGLQQLTYLDLRQNDVAGVEPLADLTGLVYLDLGSNSLEDLAPLSGLTNVMTLVLGGNQILDLRPIRGMTNLRYLDASVNQIGSLEPLAPLIHLEYLFASSNGISALDPLTGLTALRILYIDACPVEDLGPLTDLSSIEQLYLRYDAVRDIHPLVENAGLGTGDRVGLEGNPLSDQALEVDIPALEARGVTVTH
jgi:Leucine-rich repeat (LRR) protein